jgi:hypothetical protein
MELRGAAGLLVLLAIIIIGFLGTGTSASNLYKRIFSWFRNRGDANTPGNSGGTAASPKKPWSLFDKMGVVGFALATASGALYLVLGSNTLATALGLWSIPFLVACLYAMLRSAFGVGKS